MKQIEISDKEYEKLIKNLEFFDTMRNNLLTFAFTAVLITLGVALAIDTTKVNVWIFLVPFFLIIPFTARISYYRLASAHINSFLKKFGQANMQFERGNEIVKEGICKHYKIIAWLINHEMVLLGIATSCIFYIKYTASNEEWGFIDYIVLLIPILFVGFVWVIADSTYNYKKIIDKFSSEWDQYANGN